MIVGSLCRPQGSYDPISPPPRSPPPRLGKKARVAVTYSQRRGQSMFLATREVASMNGRARTQSFVAISIGQSVLTDS